MICWQLQSKNQPLIRVDRELGPLKDGWSRIKIAGCGLCHTDLGFIFTQVATRHPLPLTLGHEISGVVIEGSHKGKQVVVPAVIPCRECVPCRKGYPRICKQQLMPGNDIPGGFSELIDVPAHDLAVVPKSLGEEELARLSVVADAVTTPLQAIRNLELAAGEVAVVIGCGGVGGFAALLAKSFGAEVIAMDIDDRKLEKLARAGIEHICNVKDQEPRGLKKWLRQLCKSEGFPDFGLKIFEASGTKQGQVLAFNLLGFGARMAVVGFTMDKLEVRLSNLMAFDATLVGNWGASPEIYPEAIELALDGDLHLEDFTEIHPLEDINRIIDKAQAHQLESRAVLKP